MSNRQSEPPRDGALFLGRIKWLHSEAAKEFRRANQQKKRYAAQRHLGESNAYAIVLELLGNGDKSV